MANRGDDYIEVIDDSPEAQEGQGQEGTGEEPAVEPAEADPVQIENPSARVDEDDEGSVREVGSSKRQKRSVSTLHLNLGLFTML